MRHFTQDLPVSYARPTIATLFSLRNPWSRVRKEVIELVVRSVSIL